MRLMPSTVRPKFLGDFLDGNMTGRARERERKKSEKIRKKETYTMRKREEILGKKRQDKYPHCACCTKSTVHSVNTTESFLFTYAPIITSQPKRESPSTSLSLLYLYLTMRTVTVAAALTTPSPFILHLILIAYVII